MNLQRRMPVGFVSHGAPTLALDLVAGADLNRWGRELPTPSAVLVVSAHWERSPATIGSTRSGQLLHDFSGFPEELHRVRYPAPGAVDLARTLEKVVEGVHVDEARPWDHGVWVPLLHLFPEADVPVVQLSLPSDRGARDLLALGRKLAQLRDEGVLILASGGMVHNLRRLDWSGAAAPEAWATEFESWVRGSLERDDLDELLDFRDKAPALELAHPTLEHFLPLFVALGATNEDDRLRYPVEGFEFGSLSRLSVEMG